MPRYRGRRQAFAIVSVAALLVAVASACGSAPQARHEGSASSSAIAAVVGHKWRLTQVSAADRSVEVPESVDATFQLTSDGRFLASDSVNALSGDYTANRTGFTVTNAATTLVGYGGTDPTRLAVIAAMNGVLLRAGAVAAKTAGTALTLNAANYQLNFCNAGPAVSPSPPSPTHR